MAAPSRDYRRSNVRLTLPVAPAPESLALARELLTSSEAEEREKAGQELVETLCQEVGVAGVALKVLDAPRPHRLREGRLSYQRLGSYSPRTRTIRVHNRTALRGQVVAPRTFLETLLHELVHHLDFEHLGLSRSLHTSGFYHRVGYLKRLLAPPAEG